MHIILVSVVLAGLNLQYSRTAVIHPRIINGYNATAGQFPWMVAIRGKSKSGASIFCNGALIYNRAILTVAQCLENIKRVSVDIGSIRRDVPLVHTTSASFAIHPKFDSSTFGNNIGLIRLSNSLSFTKNIKSIQLPSLLLRNDAYTNAVAIVSGFGRLNNTGTPSDYLQFAKVKIMPDKKCQAYFGPAISTVNTMCSTGLDNLIQGACPNDNGSPLVLSEKQADILIGLTSFISTKGCDSGHPTGYIRVAPYINWIRENLDVAK